MSFNIIQPLNRLQVPGGVKITSIHAIKKKYFIGFSNGDLTIMSMSTQPEPVRAEQKSVRSFRSLSEIKRLFVDNELSQLLVPEKTFKNVTGNQAPIVTLDSLPLYADSNREVLIIGQPDTLQVFEWVNSHLNLVFSFDDVKTYNHFSHVELNDASDSIDRHSGGKSVKKGTKTTNYFLLGSQKKLLIYEIVRKSRNIFEFALTKEFSLKSRLKALQSYPERSLVILALSSSFFSLNLRDGFQLTELENKSTNNLAQNTSFSYFGLSSTSPTVKIMPLTDTTSLVIRDTEIGELAFNEDIPIFQNGSDISLSASPNEIALLHPNYLLAVYPKMLEVIEITGGQRVQTFKYQSKLASPLLCLSGSVVTIVAGNSILQFSYLSYQKQLAQFLSVRGEITPTKRKDVNNDLQLFGLERAISLLSLLSEKDDFFSNDQEHRGPPLKTKNLHLRDLFKEKALVYFESYSKYHEALVEIASDWIITYTEILHLFPDFLNGNIQINHEISQDKDSRLNPLKSITLVELKDYISRESEGANAASKPADVLKMEDFFKAVNNLIIYLTDQRRIHLSLLNSKDDNPYIVWKSVHIHTADLYPGVDKMKLKSRLEISASAIDTTLFLCYFYVKPLLLGPLLRLPNNKCDAGIVNKCILESLNMRSSQSGSFMSQLLDFYYGRSLHKDALDMLFNLSRENSNVSTEADSFLKGPWLTVRYLQKLSNSNLGLVIKYAKMAMSETPDSAGEIAQMVFMSDTYECESYDNCRVLEFFESMEEKRGLPRRYLEWLLQESDVLDSPSRAKDRDKLGTKLCLLYLKELKNSSETDDKFVETSAYKKLFAILASGTDYVPWTVLKNIPLREDRFLRLTILVYRRLGEHSKAVDVLFNQLGDFDSAVHYCADVYQEPNGQKTGQDLLHKLLEDLLMHYEENIDYVAQLLLSEGSKMSIFYILNALPKSFPLHRISGYFESYIHNTEEQMYSTRVKGQLYKIGATKLRRQALVAQSKSSLASSENEACRICNRRFGHQSLCLTPENTIVHYSCYSARA